MDSGADLRVLEEPRPLTHAERDLLDFLIEANARYSSELRALFRDTMVTKECTCGCGSIVLTTDAAAMRTHNWPSPLPVAARAHMDDRLAERLSEDSELYALLFAEVDEGYLESTWRPGGRSALPRKDQLKPVS